MKLQSYVSGGWHSGLGPSVAMRDATTGDIVAEASSSGIDFAATLSYARERGGPSLRALTFHERASLLKTLAKRLSECKEEFYTLSYRTGATRNDSWIDIDGGIGTVFAFAGKGARELPNSRVYLDGAVEGLSKSGSFVGQHVYLPREGAAVHINAYNFPVWGMLEKLAPALLAGVPVIVKPATATAYLTELVVRRIIESGILPEGDGAGGTPAVPVAFTTSEFDPFMLLPEQKAHLENVLAGAAGISRPAGRQRSQMLS